MSQIAVDIRSAHQIMTSVLLQIHMSLFIKQIISADDDRTVFSHDSDGALLWSVNTAHDIRHMVASAHSVTVLHYSKRSATVLSVEDGHVIGSNQLEGEPWCACLSGSGEVMAVGYTDGVLIVLDVRSMCSLMMMQGV